MHCPRCGTELTIYQEQKGYKWLYRMYPCPRCKLIWDWASLIRGDNYWKLEECKAWEAVGIPIIADYYKQRSEAVERYGAKSVMNEKNDTSPVK